MSAFEPVPGVEIDETTRSLSVCGVRMVVGNYEHSPYVAAHRRERANYSPAMLALLDEQFPGHFTRDVPQMPESIHATLLCGENGWWIELHVWPGGNGYDVGLTYSVPGEPYDSADCSANDVLAAWLATCKRSDTPDVEYDDPFGGLEPGTWECDAGCAHEGS